MKISIELWSHLYSYIEWLSEYDCSFSCMCYFCIETSRSDQVAAYERCMPNGLWIEKSQGKLK